MPTRAPRRTTRGERNYQNDIRSSVRALWSGNTNWSATVQALILAVQYNYTDAWARGLASCGIRMSEQTQDEINRLNYEINLEIQYIYDFTSAILSRDRAHNGKLSDLYDRVDMWVNRYGAIEDLARTYACSDQKLKWQVGYTKEHCSDCLRLDGRVYRASTWRNADLYPRKHTLECEGFRCACEFIETDEPCTPGFPPRI